MATSKPKTKTSPRPRTKAATSKSAAAKSTATKSAANRKAKPAARARSTATRKPAAPRAATTAKKPKPAATGITGRLLSWSDNLMGLAGPLTNASLALTKASWKAPSKGAALKKAAMLLLDARKSTGLTVGELARAIDLKNPELLDQAETGKAAIPFEIILRLAAVLGRNDPLSFALKLTRAYNPGLWEKMEAIGVGRLVEHVGREREFVNIYRGSDAARKLTDTEFAAVLKLMSAAFELALVFKQGDA